MQIELLDKNCLPLYKNDGDACMDCRSRVDVEWQWEGGMKVAYVPLGFKVKVPRGYALKLYSRSGHGWKDNITLANSVGIIDSGYREEVQAKLIQHSVNIESPSKVNQYDRICQMALVEVPTIYLDVVDELDTTTRGGGFGSSGVK